MIITCPNCATRYEINPSTLGADGRSVKCSSCGERWFASPHDDQPSEALLAPIENDDLEDRDTDAGDPDDVPERGDDTSSTDAAGEKKAPPDGERRPNIFAAAPGRGEAERKSGIGAVVAWLCLVFAVLIVAGLVVGRNEVVRAFPGTGKIYTSVGLPVNVTVGLDIRNVHTDRFVEHGLDVLRITGEIHNVSDYAREVPQIEVGILNGDRETLEKALFAPEKDELGPGEITRFEARMMEPPEDASNISFDFAKPF